MFFIHRFHKKRLYGFWKETITVYSSTIRYSHSPWVRVFTGSSPLEKRKHPDSEGSKYTCVVHRDGLIGGWWESRSWLFMVPSKSSFLFGSCRFIMTLLKLLISQKPWCEVFLSCPGNTLELCRTNERFYSKLTLGLIRLYCLFYWSYVFF